MQGKRQDPIYQAQAILSRRDHSRAEVVMKLKRKGFMEEDIAKALAFLQEKKLLDDARFAKMYVDSILRGKYVGPRYLSAKLKQKGVGEELIRETIAEAFTGEKEIELAQAAVDQWKRLHPKHALDKQRLYRFLVSRGFTGESLNCMVNEEGET